MLISLKNWENVKSPAGATFKNPNFKFYCELGIKLQVQLKTNIRKPRFLIYRLIWESYVLI